MWCIYVCFDESYARIYKYPNIIYINNTCIMHSEYRSAFLNLPCSIGHGHRFEKREEKLNRTIISFIYNLCIPALR